MTNNLEVDSVIVKFGEKRILSDVFLKCRTGEIVGILGRNGSGKTTLMRVIFGELKTYNKSIRINGLNYHEPYMVRELLSYLPQFNFIPKSLTVKRTFKSYNANFDDFIYWFPKFSRIYKNQLYNISGGERRIIELFLIITSNSKFCMLDEPFTHVMPVHIEEIKNLIDREKMNKGIIIIDHLYHHILDQSNRIYLIENGATAQVKDVSDLKRMGYVN